MKLYNGDMLFAGQLQPEIIPSHEIASKLLMRRWE